MSGKDDSRCKDPELGWCLVCSRSSKQASGGPIGGSQAEEWGDPAGFYRAHSHRALYRVDCGMGKRGSGECSSTGER